MIFLLFLVWSRTTSWSISLYVTFSFSQSNEQRKPGSNYILENGLVWLHNEISLFISQLSLQSKDMIFNKLALQHKNQKKNYYQTKSDLGAKAGGGVGSTDFSKMHDDICDQPFTINRLLNKHKKNSQMCPAISFRDKQIKKKSPTKYLNIFKKLKPPQRNM